MKTIYLAGPITGLSYSGATGWREYATEKLKPLRALSPMRGKEYLEHVASFTADGDAYRALNVLSSNRGIMTRDFYDCTHCDTVLANLVDAKMPSLGTVMEMAWAYAYRRPLIVVMEPGNPHEHGMIAEAISYRVETLDEGIDLAHAILDAYAGG